MKVIIEMPQQVSSAAKRAAARARISVSEEAREFIVMLVVPDQSLRPNAFRQTLLPKLLTEAFRGSKASHRSAIGYPFKGLSLPFLGLLMAGT
jgi:hypothetical protein